MFKKKRTPTVDVDAAVKASGTGVVPFSYRGDGIPAIPKADMRDKTKLWTWMCSAVNIIAYETENHVDLLTKWMAFAKSVVEGSVVERLILEGEKNPNIVLDNAQAIQRSVQSKTRHARNVEIRLQQLNSQLTAAAQPRLGIQPNSWNNMVVLPLRAQIPPIEAELDEVRRHIEEGERSMVLTMQQAKSVVGPPIQKTVDEYVELYEAILPDLPPVIASLEEMQRSSSKTVDAVVCQPNKVDGQTAAPTSLKYLGLIVGKSGSVHNAQLPAFCDEVIASVDSGVRAGVSFSSGPLKTVGRCLEKTQEDYQGDFSRLVDIARGMFLLSNLDALHGVVRGIMQVVKGKKNVSIVRVKNRLSPDFDAEEESMGYRDVLINLEIEGIVVEVQLVMQAFHEIKAIGHRLYKLSRSLHLFDRSVCTVMSDSLTREVVNAVRSGMARELVLDFTPSQLDFKSLFDALACETCMVEKLSLRGSVNSSSADSAMVKAMKVHVGKCHAVVPVRVLDLSCNSSMSAQVLEIAMSLWPRSFRSVNISQVVSVQDKNVLKLAAYPHLKELFMGQCDHVSSDAVFQLVKACPRLQHANMRVGVGALDFVFEPLKGDDPVLVAWAAEQLKDIARLEENEATIGDKGGLGLLMDAMLKFPNNQQVQHHGVMAMRNLMYVPKNLALLRSRALPVLNTAQKFTGSDPDIAKQLPVLFGQL